MATANTEMQSFAARLNTFHGPQQLSKRRASSQAATTTTTTTKKKKGGGNTIEWPHERPAPDDLARAGFFYRPAHESPDNVQCFFCTVKLDGWEPDDDPIKEHLAHSPNCPWALCLQAGHQAQAHMQNVEGGEDEEDEEEEEAAAALQDPMHEDLVAARKATFTTTGGAASWPHEGKRGWKCKVAKMVEAGWCFDPAPAVAAGEGEEDDGDGVSCFYCNLALDGWEPKDDPMAEHRRREPACAFFALVEKFGGGSGNAKKKNDAKGKGKGKGGKAGRSSTASTKASRMSTLSALSTFSEPPSLADDIGIMEDVVVEAEAGVDDSIMSTASQATATGTTTTTTTKSKKKGGRAKAPAKGAKGRKRANTADSEVESQQPLYPNLSPQIDSQPIVEDEVVATATTTSQSTAVEEPPAAAAPAKKTRKAARQSKQQLDSSVVEISSLDVAAPKKTTTTRGRKAKAPADPKPAPEPEVEADADHSEVSAQLQEELERSMDWDAQREDATPQPPPSPPPPAQPPAAKGKRGVKRTSDGLKKKKQQQHQQESEDVSAVLEEFPAPPAPPPPKAAAPAAKGKKGRKPSKQVVEESQAEQSEPPQDAALMSESEPEPSKAVKSKRAPARKGAKSRKASSTRSSKASVTTEPPTAAAATRDEDVAEEEKEEDLEKDEREIEAELQRIADEQQQQARQVQAEQDRVEEFEASPQHARKQHVDEILHLEEEEELRDDVRDFEGEEGKNMEKKYVTAVAAESSPPLHRVSPSSQTKGNATPSPNGSDKENEPSSWIQLSTKQQQQPQQQQPPAAVAAAAAAPIFSSIKSAMANFGISSPLQFSAKKAENAPAAMNTTPSPNGSDKENQPSSIINIPTSAKSARDPTAAAAAPPLFSPTKATTTTTTTTRVPLAPGTPNRAPTTSPFKRAAAAGGNALILSPTKPLPKLTSTHPWIPIDVEALSLTSSDALAQRLAGVGAGVEPAEHDENENEDGDVEGLLDAEEEEVLSKEERLMTVEEWVRFRARRREEELRAACEEMVSLFEREGLRALESLGGVVAV